FESIMFAIDGKFYRPGVERKALHDRHLLLAFGHGKSTFFDLGQIDRLASVHRVSYYCRALRSQMYTYLVHTTRNRFAFDQCIMLEITHTVEDRLCGFSVCTIYTDILVSLVQYRKVHF